MPEGNNSSDDNECECYCEQYYGNHCKRLLLRRRFWGFGWLLLVDVRNLFLNPFSTHSILLFCSTLMHNIGQRKLATTFYEIENIHKIWKNVSSRGYPRWDHCFRLLFFALPASETLMGHFPHLHACCELGLFKYLRLPITMIVIFKWKVCAQNLTIKDWKNLNLFNSVLLATSQRWGRRLLAS